MFIKTFSTAILAVCLLAGTLRAEQSSARIDFTVKSGKIEFKNPTDKNLKMYYASWVKDEAKKVQRVSAEGIVDDSKWTKITFELSVTEDGPLSIGLKSRWSKTDRNWVYFDDITVEGAEKPIVNGSFEEAGKWSHPKGQQVLDESLAHTGKGAVLVWHDKASYQSVQAKAGQTITVSAWAKFCKTESKEPK